MSRPIKLLTPPAGLGLEVTTTCAWTFLRNPKDVVVRSQGGEYYNGLSGFPTDASQSRNEL